MPKMTLLDMTQQILSSMDSDEVNSISDTVESLQVAEIVRETYYELVETLKIPEKGGVFQLDALTDVSKPNYLRVPANVNRINWIKYNGLAITYMNPDDFFYLYTSIDTDRDPLHWTTLDDNELVFSSYNALEDTTLQSSKSSCWGFIDNAFRFEDNAIPDLDANLFPLLYNEAKSTCFVDLKQVSNSKSEQKARRQLVRAQNDFTKRKSKQRLPDYGRRR